MSKLLLREGLKTIAVVLLRLSYLPVHQEGIHPTFLTMKIRCLSLWRILVDPTIDTDRDGSPDWAEFEIAARGTGVLIPDVIGNPFDADTNADGTPDGEQLAAELDGTELWALSALHGIRIVTRWVDGPELAEKPGRLATWSARLDSLRRAG